MEIRNTTLPDDLLYFLDCSTECGHLTGGAHAALNLYGDAKQIDDICEGPTESGHHVHSLALKGIKLERLARTVIDQLDDPEVFRSISFASQLRSIADYAEFASRAAYEDAFKGDHGLSPSCTLTKGGKKAKVKMASQGWIKRQSQYHLAEWDFLCRLELWRTCGAPAVLIKGANEVVSELFRQIYRRRDQAIAREMAKLGISLPKAKPKPKLPRSVRRSTIKAAAFASALLGASTVSSFASGNPVEIPANDIVVEVSLGRSIHSKGHGSLRVKLKDVDGGFLTNLCIYQDLPALDQLASIAMFAQAGEIDQVLDAGNCFNVAPEAIRHPAIARSRSNERPLTANNDDLARIIENNTGPEFYWLDTRELWIERFFVMAFGRQSKAALDAYYSLNHRGL
ncbi:MAG: hypothetical protein AAF468_20635 [Pseudomonadota bacterium]